MCFIGYEGKRKEREKGGKGQDTAVECLKKDGFGCFFHLRGHAVELESRGDDGDALVGPCFGFALFGRLFPLLCRWRLCEPSVSTADLMLCRSKNGQKCKEMETLERLLQWQQNCQRRLLRHSFSAAGLRAPIRILCSMCGQTGCRCMFLCSCTKGSLPRG